jgi:hypothetical protein
MGNKMISPASKGSEFRIFIPILTTLEPWMREKSNCFIRLVEDMPNNTKPD